jgi:hypothetical protein
MPNRFYFKLVRGGAKFRIIGNFNFPLHPKVKYHPEME